MTFRILWPAMRWPGDRHIEAESVGENQAEFCERFSEVTDEQWANCDAIVTVNDILCRNIVSSGLIAMPSSLLTIFLQSIDLNCSAAVSLSRLKLASII